MLGWCYDIHPTTSFFLQKPTDVLIFPNLLLSRNSTCFEQFLCPSSGVFHCTFGTGICHTGFMTAFKHDQNTCLQIRSCLKAVIKPVWHIPVPNVQWKTPDDGQRNCPKHVEFLDNNKFRKISAPVGLGKKNFVTMQYGHMNVKSSAMFRLLMPAIV